MKRRGKLSGTKSPWFRTVIINQPFLRDNVFGVGFKPRIPLTPLAWRFANFLEFLYIIDDENIYATLLPLFIPSMKLVLFFLLLLLLFHQTKNSYSFLPRFFTTKFTPFLEREREREKILVKIEEEHLDARASNRI